MIEKILRITKEIDHRRLRLITNRILNRISIIGWRKNYRLFNQYYIKRQWDAAAVLGGNLVGYLPDDLEFRHRLAVCYWSIGQKVLAEQNMKAALAAKLKRNPNCDLEMIVQLLHQSIALEPCSVRAEYVYMGGEANLGFLEHIRVTPEGETRYLTKIISNLTAASKEKRFYTEICGRYPIMHKLIPKMVKIIELPACKLCLITNEKINGRTTGFEHLTGIIRLVDIMGSIRADNALNKINMWPKHGKYNLSERYGFPFVGFNAAFTSIDQESSNKQVFHWLEARAEKMPLASEACQLVRRVREVILTERMFEKLIPEENFNFCHLNFSKGNILVDESDNQFRIVDWEMYGFAPRGYSLIQFIHEYDLPFSQIRKIYLDDWPEEELSNLIGKIFFVYPLIVAYFVRAEHLELDKFIKEHLQPAVDYLEFLKEKVNNLSNFVPADSCSGETNTG